MDVIGHIGGDAVVRDGQGQQRAISFSVAHTEKYNDAQGVKHERTVWVSCTLWRYPDKLAIVPHLTKGTRVFVTGQPSAAAYVPNQGGEPRADLRLRVDSIELLGSAHNNQQGGTFNGGQPQQTNYQPKAAAPANQIPDNTDDDSLPF
jgi:single-strand DNA-binding protein